MFILIPIIRGEETGTLGFLVNFPSESAANQDWDFVTVPYMPSQAMEIYLGRRQEVTGCNPDGTACWQCGQLAEKVPPIYWTLYCLQASKCKPQRTMEQPFARRVWGEGAAEPPILDSASMWHKEEFISQAVFCLTDRVIYGKEIHYSGKAIWKDSSAVHFTIVSECNFKNNLKIRLRQLGTFTDNKPN